MQKLSQTLKIALALFIGVFSSGLVQLYVAPSASALTPPSPTTPVASIDICHATKSNTNPYNIESPNTSSTGIGGGNGDHSTHTGPVWNPSLKDAGVAWGDIIPPFTDLSGRTFAGLNWNATGQLIYANNCTVPTPTVTALMTQCASAASLGSITVTANNVVHNAVLQVSDSANTLLFNTTLNGLTTTNHTVPVTSLLAGTYTVKIFYDGVVKASTTVTVTTCAVVPANPTVTAHTPKCSKSGAATGSVSASITNTDDATNAAVVYAWQIKQGATVIASGTSSSIADGASDTISATGLAAGTYTLVITGSDQTTASDSFTVETCLPEVTPDAAVVKDDLCGLSYDTFTIPEKTGVTYHIGDTDIAAGDHYASDYLAGDSLSLTVTATVNTGYVLAENATTSWTLDFTNTACQKITICHATNSTSNPYNKISVNTNAADGVSGNSGTEADHYSHTGPIYSDGITSSWGDIIPPITGVHDGLNWTTGGEVIWNNDCQPVPVTPTPPVKYDFCYDDIDQISVPETTGVIYRVNGSDSDYSGRTVYFDGSDIVITASPAEGYVFTEDAVTSWTYTAENFTNKQCVSITKTGSAPADTNHDGVISTGDLVTWKITLTNNGVEEIDSFDLTVIDEGATFEGESVINDLAPGESITLTVTKPITVHDMQTCKATNTASFTVDNLAYDHGDINPAEKLFKVIAIEDNVPPVVGGSTDATVTFTCPTPGKGQVISTTTTELPAQLPATGPTAEPANPLLALVAAVIAYGATYFFQRRRSVDVTA